MAILVTRTGLHSTSIEQDVDVDIRGFDAYFQSLGNDPLDKFERAAIKTYLWYKLHREDPNAQNADSPVRM